MRNLRNYSFLLILLGLLFSTCSKEKYEATLPTYITIESIVLTTDYANEGSASSAISDAWVYVNDDLIGVYELPATFPVLREGNVELKVFAGIKDNGISASRARYTLLDPHVQQVDLIKGETIKISPQFKYNSAVNFAWLEDFENVSLSFLYTSGSDTVINRQNTDVKEGSFSGSVVLTDDMDFFEATSIAYSNIPRLATPVYLEMDFKTNEPLLVGIYHNQDAFAVVTLNTTETWKKIYINLTEMVSSRQSASDVKVFFGMLDSSADPFLTSSPQVHIDNLKLVHY